MSSIVPIYNPAEIEPRWQQAWENDGIYRSDVDESRPKFYALTMLPYPSGDLHIGHWFAISPSDARARYMRMRGYNVMFPMGFDAFGLPAENAAIKRNIHPKEWTYANIARMREQLRTMGTMIDWRREAVSADPEYYHWTQWFFLQFFKNDLAYHKFSPVDWCPNCNTTLAREQVWGDDRHCERCGTPVIKKNLDQWFFRTTRYAEELLRYDGIDWPERVRTLQTNWIGKSEGAAVYFTTEAGERLEVFTTRPDTLFGATFMVLAPEHPLVASLTTPEQKRAVEAYILQASKQTDVQREAADKEKSGVFTGGYAINPVNGRRIPVWIADYVLMTYGTGAIMAVPAHDERDFAFAIKFGLPIIPVIARQDQLCRAIIRKDAAGDNFVAQLSAANIPAREESDSLWVEFTVPQLEQFSAIITHSLLPGKSAECAGSAWRFWFPGTAIDLASAEDDAEILRQVRAQRPDMPAYRTVMEMLSADPVYEGYRDILYHADYGMMIHSERFTGTPGEQAKKALIRWLEAEGKGKGSINYRLRDWLISRQRYWGAPIPMVHCPRCGVVPVPEDQLPVLLPDDVEWRPTGESPLKLHPTWRFTTCPNCGGAAERDTDTMDTFMCSSWYHLRYLSPHYDKGPFDDREYNYWMPVDLYTGGIEHATMHLIYTRFFHKACRDLGITEGNEPMLTLRNQGMVLGEDSEKMSKSRGNVVAPDELVKKYGADTVRAYLMFFSRWDQGGPWSYSGIEGTSRWLRRSWFTLLEDAPLLENRDPQLDKTLRRKTHQVLARVIHDYENFEFNTIISSLMELMNEMTRLKALGLFGSPAWKESEQIFLQMLAPVTPHIAEELWRLCGHPYSIHTSAWPAVDQEAARDEEMVVVLQVNGKVRDRLTMPAGADEQAVRAAALENSNVQRFLEGRTPRQMIYIKGKLLNIVL